VGRLRQVDGAWLEHLPAPEGEELLRERHRALRGRRDVVQVASHRVVDREVLRHEVRVAEDDGEDVVEVVRDAAREAADRLHLLRAP